MSAPTGEPRDGLVHARQKLRDALSNLSALTWGLGLAWRSAPRSTSIWLLLLVVQGLLPAATVYLTREIVDALAHALGKGLAWENIQAVATWGSCMALVLLLGEGLQSVAGWVHAHQGERIREDLARLIHEHSTTIDLAFYETPEYFDHLHRAQVESQQRPLMLLEQTGRLLQAAVSLLAMLSILVPLGAWLPLALILSTAPGLYVVVRFAAWQYGWRVRTTAQQRKARYYDALLAGREAAAELRVFGLGGYFGAAYQDIIRQLRTERLDLMRKENAAQLFSLALAVLVTALSLAWIVLRALRGQATLGDVAFFYQAFNQGQRLMRTALQQAGHVFGNVLYLADLRRFVEIQPRIVAPVSPLPVPGGPLAICFENVTFSYPSSDGPVLARFDLEIPAGRMIAVVGDNGAGKSTLIKLICRLYDPQGGRVTLGGIDLRQLDLEGLRRSLAVLFQQPVHYAATVAQNIAFGDLSGRAGRPRIEAAAFAAGADEVIAHLPRGFETLLGTRFVGGHELSVGEWQRIALARAILRDAPVVLLDEPTSAMDSWAEASWMDRLRKETCNKTVLLITHRFTTAMRADLVCVMREGRIVETGAHAELVAAGGRYSQSWRKQVEEYGR